MPETQLGFTRLAWVVGLSALTVGMGLGSSGRLTYHEAFVAQGAREMIATGNVLVPTIDGQPWLEKPPLAFWMVAGLGKLAGGVTEFVARVPSALAAMLLTVGVAVFASRRFGRDIGWLAGMIQATTFWLVVRGRLAEADIVLACLVTWMMVAFDRLRTQDSGLRTEPGDGQVLDAEGAALREGESSSGWVRRADRGWRRGGTGSVLRPRAVDGGLPPRGQTTEPVSCLVLRAPGGDVAGQGLGVWRGPGGIGDRRGLALGSRSIGLESNAFGQRLDPGGHPRADLAGAGGDPVAGGGLALELACDRPDGDASRGLHRRR